MQRALKEGKLKFEEKDKNLVQVDDDPLQIKDAYYTELVECLVVKATEGSNDTMKVMSEPVYADKIKVVYPYAEEEFIYFLNKYKWKDSEVMMFPRCSEIFYKKATEGLESIKP